MPKNEFIEFELIGKPVNFALLVWTTLDVVCKRHQSFAASEAHVSAECFQWWLDANEIAPHCNWRTSQYKFAIMCQFSVRICRYRLILVLEIRTISEDLIEAKKNNLYQNSLVLIFCFCCSLIFIVVICVLCCIIVVGFRKKTNRNKLNPNKFGWVTVDELMNYLSGCEWCVLCYFQLNQALCVNLNKLTLCPVVRPPIAVRTRVSVTVSMGWIPSRCRLTSTRQRFKLTWRRPPPARGGLCCGAPWPGWWGRRRLRNTSRRFSSPAASQQTCALSKGRGRRGEGGGRRQSRSEIRGLAITAVSSRVYSSFSWLGR